MKATIPTKQFVAALSALTKVSKPSTISAILGNVLIGTTEDESVRLLGTDTDKQLSITLPAKVSEDGATTLNCHRLHRALSEMSGDECIITTDEKHATVIKCGSAVLNMKGLAPEEMPAELSVESGEVITMPAERFNDILAKALLHSSQDKARALYMSVLFVSRAKKLSIEATDGRRAFLCGTDADYKGGTAIVPRESIPSMIALASTGEIELTIGSNAIVAKTESCAFATKLIEGSMQNLSSVIPDKDKRTTHVTVNREELASLSRRAGAFMGDAAFNLGIPIVDIHCSDGKLTMRAAAGNEDQSGEDYIAARGDDVELSVNPTFLHDGLKALAGNEITLEFVDSISPFVMSEETTTVIIVPMRTK